MTGGPHYTDPHHTVYAPGAIDRLGHAVSINLTSWPLLASAMNLARAGQSRWQVGPMRPADLTSLSRARSSHSHWFAGPRCQKLRSPLDGVLAAADSAGAGVPTSPPFLLFTRALISLSRAHCTGCRGLPASSPHRQRGGGRTARAIPPRPRWLLRHRAKPVDKTPQHLHDREP